MRNIESDVRILHRFVKDILDALNSEIYKDISDFKAQMRSWCYITERYKSMKLQYDLYDIPFNWLDIDNAMFTIEMDWVNTYYDKSTKNLKQVRKDMIDAEIMIDNEVSRYQVYLNKLMNYIRCGGDIEY